MQINSRIKRLALKSGLVVEEGFGNLISPWLENADLSEEVQKFGELVIAECIEILQEREKALDNIKVFNDYDVYWLRARKTQAALMIAEIRQQFELK